MTPATFTSIRKRAGLTQSGLAAYLRLGDNGGRYIRMIEAGDRTPSGPVILCMERLSSESVATSATLAIALSVIRDELAGSTTDKGRKLHAIAADALETQS